MLFAGVDTCLSCRGDPQKDPHDSCLASLLQLLDAMARGGFLLGAGGGPGMGMGMGMGAGMGMGMGMGMGGGLVAGMGGAALPPGATAGVGSVGSVAGSVGPHPGLVPGASAGAGAGASAGAGAGAGAAGAGAGAPGAGAGAGAGAPHAGAAAMNEDEDVV